MGRILTADVQVMEEMQRAIILHNLDQEVLILSTEIVGPERSTIVRFIPFPSEPGVSLARGRPFEAVAELIKKHGLKFSFHSKRESIGAGSPIRQGKPVDIRLHVRLGAHDATVVKINEPPAFGRWVRQFFSEKELNLARGFRKVEEVARDYVQRGFQYFVFDLVEVPREPKAVSPLVYRFKTSRLYYPLKTSNTFGGKGGIDLFIVAPVTLCDPNDDEALYVEQKGPRTPYLLHPCLGPLGEKAKLGLQVSDSKAITKTEALCIHESAESLFSDFSHIFLQVIRYWGAYRFDDDIFVDISLAPRWAAGLLSDVRILPFPPPAASREDVALQGECVRSILTAIGIEMRRCEQQLRAAKEGPGDPADAPVLEARLRELAAERARYEGMDPAAYPLPLSRVVTVRPTRTYRPGDLLELEDLTRSGPFYHVVGIRGGDLGGLKPGKKYRVTLYLVYPMRYPFPSYYVYVSDF